jgi:endo-1,4-beta-xylanase
MTGPSRARAAPPVTIASASAALMLFWACGGSPSPAGPSPSTPPPVNPSGDERSLRQAGQAVGKLVGTAVQAGLLNTSAYRAVAARDFNYLTAEYEMKWNVMEPSRDVPDFSRGDAIVAFADSTGAKVKGHALIWHASIPAWASSLPPEAFHDAVMSYINEAVTHFRGRVFAWDVVNEAVAESGSGLRDTMYRQKLGDRYIAEAFLAARAADPHALLFYNDYGGEGLGAKSDRIYDLMRSLLAQGVPVDGIGLQMHISANNRPSDPSIASNMRRLADLGLLVNISEMDVKVNGVAGSAETRLAVQRSAFHDVVRVCVVEPRCHAVTFWGFTDAHTWLSGETPLLYDTQYAAKPSFFGVLDAFAGR